MTRQNNSIKLRYAMLALTFSTVFLPSQSIAQPTSNGTYGSFGYQPLQAGPPKGGPSTAWPARGAKHNLQPSSPVQNTTGSAAGSSTPSSNNQSSFDFATTNTVSGAQSSAQPSVQPGAAPTASTIAPAMPPSNNYRPAQGFAERGQDIDKTVLDAGWARAKRRDAQGMPGSSIANPNERPPVPEDKASMTPLEKSKLAYWYWKTERVSKLPRAVQLMTEAAEAGDSRSQAVLADWYTRGIREALPVDDSKALYWNQKAAAAGQRVSQLALGDNYYNGLLVPKDYSIAFQWFMKAAQQNFPTAELAVAQAYCTGEGVGENRAEALRWFNKSKADGCTSAQNFLDVLYLSNCPAHFSSLQELMAFGHRYEKQQSDKNRAESQKAFGQNKMMNSPVGSFEYRQGAQIYNRAQQNINNSSVR